MARVEVRHGDSREVLKTFADGSIHAIVCDPPYSLQTINKRFAKVGRNDKTWSSSGPHQRTARGFMNQKWDTGETAFDPAFWAEALRVLKPGGHLIAFGGTRTYHRLVCAIEDAGFEIRDTIAWLYGSGFPKSHNVSKGIDKAAGIEREDKFEGAFARRAGPTGNKRCDVCGKWLVSGSPCQCPRPQDAAVSDAARKWEGWGTALKPALEPICLARKPLDGTVAGNVLKHGTGALNIDGCRVATDENLNGGAYAEQGNRGVSQSLHGDTGMNVAGKTVGKPFTQPLGRWPANACHDGSDEVVNAFPDTGISTGGRTANISKTSEIYGGGKGLGQNLSADSVRGDPGFGDNGRAARFFYSARPDDLKRFHYSSKADADDRLQSRHPTIKPVDLMRWLVRLITPPGGTVLDPFAGSGTTGMACMAEGIDCILVEREAEYVADIRRRLAHVRGDDTPLFSQ